jgi:hypothetical protein
VNDESETICNDRGSIVWWYPGIHLEGMEKIRKHSGYQFFGPKFELGTSIIWIRNVIYSTTTFGVTYTNCHCTVSVRENFLRQVSFYFSALFGPFTLREFQNRNLGNSVGMLRPRCFEIFLEIPVRGSHGSNARLAVYGGWLYRGSNVNVLLWPEG